MNTTKLEKSLFNLSRSLPHRVSGFVAVVLFSVCPMSLSAPGDLSLFIPSPTLQSGSIFGFSLASTPNGDIIVGANNADVGLVPGAGSAYLFDGLTGQLRLSLPNPTPEAGDQFGSFLASTPDGNIIIGAPTDNTGGSNSGSVYVFDGRTGQLLLSLSSPTPEPDGFFGWGVTSTPNGDIIVSSSGTVRTVYLFDGRSGQLRFSLTNPTPQTGDGFGGSIASTPTGNIIVGDPSDKTSALFAGSVYLFDGNTGQLLLSLPNPTPEDFENFGNSVASTPSGDIIVGSEGDNTGVSKGGSAYLFDGRSGQLLFAMPNPTPPTRPDVREDYAVSVASTPTGDIVVGAPLDHYGTKFGSVYLFDGQTGQLLLTLNNPASSVNQHDYFGRSVASAPNGNIIVGAYDDDTAAPDAGSVYVFAGATPPPANIQVEPAEATLDRLTSDRASVSILLNSDNLFAAEVSCQADPTLVEIVSVNYAGQLFDPANSLEMPVSLDPVLGSFSGSASLIQPAVPISGAGEFITVQYRVIGNNGSTPITCQGLLSDSLGQALPNTVADGNLLIINGSSAGAGVISGQIVLPNQQDNSGNRASTTNTTTADTFTTATDSAGNFSFTNLVDGTFTLTVGSDSVSAGCVSGTVSTGGTVDLGSINLFVGDINLSGAVDIGDFALMASSYGLSVGDGGFDSRADINGDGQVNVFDLAILGNHFGLDSCAL